MNSRRKFIKKTATAIGAFTIVPSSVLFAKPEIKNRAGEIIKSRVVAPSDKVNMAICGIGNQGGSDLQSFNSTGLVNITTLCDVDMGARQTTLNMNAFPDAKKYQDFREMFDKSLKDFDAVSVGIPDFAHFPVAILAMWLGKHVYVEKPLTRTFNESELLINAAKKYKVVTQMGNQGHFEANYFQFKTWVEHGIIKDVTAITAHMNNSRRWHGWDTSMTEFPVNPNMPETLD